MSDSGHGQINRRGRPKAAGAGDEHGGSLELFLGFFPPPLEHHLALVNVAFNGRQRHKASYRRGQELSMMQVMKRLWRDLKPVEHGSWGLFLIPLALGAWVSRGGLAGQTLLAVSTLGVFLMRRPALRWLRAFNRESLDAIHTFWPGRALALCLGITLAGGIPLLVLGHVYLILVSTLAAGLMWSEVYMASDRERHPFLSA